MVFAPFYIEAPPGKPIPYGLFSVAEVHDSSDAHWSGGGIELENHLGCGGLTVATQPCDTPTTKTEFISPEYITGAPLTAYAQYTCRGPSEFNNAKDYATKALVAGEERAVERAFFEETLALADDITPVGETLTALEGIALLEGWFPDVSGPFAPTLHLNRTTATLGWAVIERHGNHLETVIGSDVAAGAGYFQDGYDEAGSWIIATGPIVVMRGVAQVHDPYFVQDPMDNTFVALAERTFSFAYLCSPLKVLVSNDSTAGAGDVGEL